MNQEIGDQRVRLKDAKTGRELWRLTGGEWHWKHAYYDISPYHPGDGTLLLSRARPGDLPDPKNRSLPTQAGELWRLAADGSAGKQLASGTPFQLHVGTYAQWTRDGSGVIYGDELHDFTRFLDLASGVTRELAGIFGRQVSPDGTRLACHNQQDGMVILRLADLAREQVVNFAALLAAAPGREKGHAGPRRQAEFARLVVANTKWSPDGSRLLLRMSGQYADDGTMRKDLFVVNADGSGLRRLAAASPGFHHHSWHHDGERVLMGDRTEAREPRLYWLDVDRDTRTMISDAPLAGHPCLSPDGRQIVTDTGEGLTLIDAASGATTLLVTRGPQSVVTDAHALWRHDGGMILYDSSESGTCQVYAVPV